MKKLINKGAVIAIIALSSGCAYKGVTNINVAGKQYGGTNAVEATTTVPIEDVANGNTVTPTGL